MENPNDYGTQFLREYVKYVNFKLGEVDKQYIEQQSNDNNKLYEPLSSNAACWAVYYDVDIYTLNDDQIRKLPKSIRETLDYSYNILNPAYYYIESAPTNHNRFGVVWQEIIQILDSIDNWEIWDSVNNTMDMICKSEATKLFTLDVINVQNKVLEITSQYNTHMTLHSKFDYHFFDFMNGNILTVYQAQEQLNREYEYGLIDIPEEQYIVLQDSLSKLGYFKSIDFNKHINEYYLNPSNSKENRALNYIKDEVGRKCIKERVENIKSKHDIQKKDNLSIKKVDKNITR